MASRFLTLNASRSRILNLIQSTPGLGLRELVRRSRLASGTVAYHVSRLVRDGAVWRTRFDTRVLHFAAEYPRDSAHVREAYEASTLDPLDRAVLVFVREAPRVQKQILDRFELEAPRSSVQHRLYYLVRLGYLASVWRGRRLCYEAVTGGTRHGWTVSGHTLDAQSWAM